MGFEQQLIENYASVGTRLGKTAPAPRRMRQVPPPPPVEHQPRVSPFIRAEKMAAAIERARLHRLFPKVIVEIDDEGNEVNPVRFIKPKWLVIQEEVAGKHGVTLMDLRSHRRNRVVCAARQEAMWRMKHETEMSFPAIAMKFGGRDHTTAMHGVEKHAERLRAGLAQ
jgi:hypothetical protein